MTVHNVTTCTITIYIVKCMGYITVPQQFKCTFKFYYICLISVNVITVTTFELIIYAVFAFIKIKMQILDL
jgi:hypothetical protein